jgi:hypothetical protein
VPGRAVVDGRIGEDAKLEVEEDEEIEEVEEVEEDEKVEEVEVVGCADDGVDSPDTDCGDPFDGDVEGLGVTDSDDEGNGPETSVVAGELTSMIEYFVAVAVEAGGVMVMSRVLVVSGPSIVFVVTISLVVGGSVSVSRTVFVAGAGVWMMVSIMVCAAGESVPVGAAAPPSTATTEYVALRASGSRAMSREMNGNDEPSKKREDRVKSEKFELLSFMMADDKAQRQSWRPSRDTCGYAN